MRGDVFFLREFFFRALLSERLDQLTRIRIYSRTQDSSGNIGNRACVVKRMKFAPCSASLSLGVDGASLDPKSVAYLFVPSTNYGPVAFFLEVLCSQCSLLWPQLRGFNF